MKEMIEVVKLFALLWLISTIGVSCHCWNRNYRVLDSSRLVALAHVRSIDSVGIMTVDVYEVWRMAVYPIYVKNGGINYSDKKGHVELSVTHSELVGWASVDCEACSELLTVQQLSIASSYPELLRDESLSQCIGQMRLLVISKHQDGFGFSHIIRPKRRYINWLNKQKRGCTPFKYQNFNWNYYLGE